MERHQEVYPLRHEAFSRYRRAHLPPHGGYDGYRLGLRLRQGVWNKGWKQLPLHPWTRILTNSPSPTLPLIKGRHEVGLNKQTEYETISSFSRHRCFGSAHGQRTKVCAARHGVDPQKHTRLRACQRAAHPGIEEMAGRGRGPQHRGHHNV